MHEQLADFEGLIICRSIEPPGGTLSLEHSIRKSSNNLLADDQGKEFLLELRWRIDYAQSHYGRGDSHFLAGLEMLERLRMLNELAKASVDYAQLLEQQGKDHEALVHYRRAFEIRQKMGGSPR